MRRRPLLAFFGLTYALSWTFWLVALYGAQGTGATAAEYGALFGPVGAAALVAWRTGRLREWFAGIVRWRVPARWWAVAFGIPVVCAVALHLVLVLVGGEAVDFSLLPAQAISYLPVLVVFSIAGGGLNEEPGWRGFALPHLQQRLSAVRATMALGIAWAVWHLPSFAFPEAPMVSNLASSDSSWSVRW
jgi:membrane protease YdiL (CAAX protease family)